ncbi:MAG: carboxylate--amine ligase [Planctomycetota bacterium]|jgi:predicted ATP-grasp superfamily ATP-dependent carboligase
MTTAHHLRGETILVTDADRGAAIAVIRSLGRAGFRVIAGDAHPRSLGFCSRYARERLVYPPPAAAPAAFIETLCRAVRSRKVDLVIPVTDEVVSLLARHRDRFEGTCRLAIAEDRPLRMVMDKSETVRLAERLGVPTPRTSVVKTPQEAAAAAESLGWPVVIKTAVSPCYVPSTGRLERRPVRYANSPSQLARRMDRVGGGHRVLIQEYCPGVGQGVEILADRGRVVTAFQHRRLAEIPPSGGASAWRESVPLDPALYRHAAQLVEALSWTGLIMVEFKVGPSVKLMEINGRVWGSLPLAVLSGVDFPARLAALLLGKPAAVVEPKPAYRVGVQAFNLELISLWILEILAGRRRYPFLTYPRRRDALSAALGAVQGLLDPSRRFDILSRDDLRPGMAELPKIAGKLARKLRESMRPAEADHG